MNDGVDDDEVEQALIVAGEQQKLAADRSKREREDLERLQLVRPSGTDTPKPHRALQRFVLSGGARKATHKNGMLRKMPCDVKVVCCSADGEHVFEAHKYPLCQCSVFFQKRFAAAGLHAGECGVPTVKLADMQPKIFEEILNYVYTQQCAVETDTLLPVIWAADLLEIEPLVELALDLLARELSQENATDVLALVDTGMPPGVDAAHLRAAALAHLLANFEAVAEAGCTDRLSPSHWKELLSSDELEAPEEVVFASLLRWHRARRTARRDPASPARPPQLATSSPPPRLKAASGAPHEQADAEFMMLLRLVRFPLFAPASLGTVVHDAIDMSAGIACLLKDLILEACRRALVYFGSSRRVRAQHDGRFLGRLTARWT
jgi:hypothetical protein